MNNIYNLKLISELNGKARVEIVSGTEHPSTGEANVLYLVKPAGATTYDQWVCEVGGTTETPTYTWTKVGNDADLSAYLKKTDAPGYNDILTQTSAASTYRTVADSYTKTEVDTAVGAKLDSTTAASTYRTIADSYTKTEVDTALSAKLDTTTAASTYVTQTEYEGTQFTTSKAINELQTSVAGKLDSTTAASTYRTIADSYNKSQVDTAVNAKLDATTAASTYRTIADSYTKTEVDTAVSGVSSRVTTIEGVIPSAASSENKLADVNFVNSSIATSTATFRGSWRLVEDLELTVADANDEKKIATALKAKMDAHSPAIIPDDNDYAYVIIPAHDSEGVHYETRFDRYKFGAWIEETVTYYWSYEFSLNNSSFTAVQWAAINSGVTSGKITTYDAHVADTDIHVTAAQKTSWDAKLDASTAAATYVTQTEYEGTQFTTSKAINELQTSVAGKLDSTTAASTYRTIADSYTKTQVDTAVSAKLDSTTAASTYRTIADSYTKTEVDTAVGAKLDSTTAASTYRTIADSYTKTEVDTALGAKLDSTTAASTYRTIAAAEEAEMVVAKAINRHETQLATCVKNGDGSITLHDNTGDVVITAQLLRELLSLIEKNS